MKLVPFREYNLRVLLETVLPIVEEKLGSKAYTVQDIRDAINASKRSEIEPKTIEVTIDGVTVDTGYGERDADLVADVQLNSDGTFIVESGTYFIIDQDGGNAGYMEYDGERDEALIERAKAYFAKQK